MENKKVSLTQAIKLLPKGRYVHTFRDEVGILFGCDFRKKDIIELMRKHKHTLELTGKNARAMDHGLAIDDAGYLFIKTDKDKMDLFDKPVSRNI